MTPAAHPDAAEQDTICALATPPGRGAVGIIRISGRLALSVLRRLTGRERFRPRRLVPVQVLGAGGARIDRALACYMPGPASYTGQDVAELHGHGGQLNMRRLLRRAVDLGARPAEPGEFTRRAFLAGKLDLAQAEAVGELIAARSARALDNAAALLAGRLGDRLGQLRARIVELAAQLEARLDFADDTVDDAAGDRALGDALQACAAELTQLAATHDRASHLEGVSVALVGPVNAGKSSLFNALAGRRRALVADEPGTTRDYLELTLEWSGAAVTLIDSAGVRSASDAAAPPLERASHALSAPRLEQADLRVAVLDLLRNTATPADAWLAGASVVAANKIDRVPGAAAAVEELRRRLGRPVVATCALDGRGVDALREQIVRLTLPTAEPESLTITSARQRSALEAAAGAIAEAREALMEQQLGPELVVEHLRAALRPLDHVTGRDVETVDERVLDEVFARFCVGK